MSDPIKPTPEIYRKAARIIEEEGWAKGVYASKSVADPTKRCYCMEGALMKAAKLPLTWKSIAGRGFSIVEFAEKILNKKTKDKYVYCVEYNDSSRSAKPVIKMLNDIADALEKEQANA